MARATPRGSRFASDVRAALDLVPNKSPPARAGGTAGGVAVPVSNHERSRPTTRRPHACARGFYTAGRASMPPAAFPGLRPAARASRLAFVIPPFPIKAHLRELVGLRVAWPSQLAIMSGLAQQPAVPTLARGDSIGCPPLAVLPCYVACLVGRMSMSWTCTWSGQASMYTTASATSAAARTLNCE